jgi:hypothetical protein
MSITLTGFVLFLHIAVVIAAFMIAGFLHAAFHVLPRAKTVAEMRSWATLMHRLEPMLPLLAIGILGFGAWLVHLEGGDGVGWSDGWVLTPLISLVVIEGLAGATLAPRTKALCEKVAQAADGAVPEELRRLTLDRTVWNVGHVATFGLLGVVFVMAVKPDGGVAWLFPVVGAVVGIVLADLQLRAANAGGGSVPSQRSGSDSRTEANA